MNWLDYVIIGITIISVGVAVVRGFVKEVLSLANWAFAFWVAITFLPTGESWLSNYIATPSVLTFSAFFLLFIISLILGTILSGIVIKFMEKVGLGNTDHLLGVVFGFVRAAAIIAVLILAARATPLPNDDWWKASTLRGHFEPLAQWVHGYLPKSVASEISFNNSSTYIAPPPPAVVQPTNGTRY